MNKTVMVSTLLLAGLLFIFINWLVIWFQPWLRVCITTCSSVLHNSVFTSLLLCTVIVISDSSYSYFV